MDNPYLKSNNILDFAHYLSQIGDYYYHQGWIFQGEFVNENVITCHIFTL